MLRNFLQNMEPPPDPPFRMSDAPKWSRICVSTILIIALSAVAYIKISAAKPDNFNAEFVAICCRIIAYSDYVLRESLYES
jgi:hypothetical protein